ncbi:KCNKI-like protein [Mya arenaria]|uniref:KCNKI-like protein n=1 Tax=Mya arenaria TaxID=6604 RepID=A0ABY7DMV3_MYAAR|nr:TWiK family of potassium channels protein 7-like [Mya arenaria]WAQ98057.1 KCNKI-like protein [Mya arenaria]
MGSEEVEKEQNSKKQLCKSIAQVAFSHIGLCLIVFSYCVLGGVLFELLEKDNEIQACVDSRKEYIDMENETLFSLLDVVLNNQLNSEAADAQLLGVFETFRNNSFSISYDGSWCEGYGQPDGPMHEWTFAGGLFFSMTVITTIGYGHISPKTMWGRILCISYAMIGIPLMLLFLSNIGDILADVFRYVYAKVICCGCMRPKRKGRQQEDQRSDTSSPDIHEPHSDEKPKFSTIAKLEPGFATIIAQRQMGSRARIVNTGSTSTHEGIEVTQRIGSMGGQPHAIKTLGSSDLAERSRRLRLESGHSTEPLIIDDASEIDEEEDWEEINKVSVPLTVSLGIIGLYIIGGAVLFKYWEGWDMLQSSYFCFITLSTIGFGDVTPGRDFSDPLANVRLIIGTIYSIFGMAILSMCFTLMQEEMTAKFQWVGRKLGVIEKDDGDESVHEELGGDRNQSEC